MLKSLLLVPAILGSLCLAQPSATKDSLTRLLTFEAEHTGGMPAGWSGAGATVDDRIVRSGKWSARLEGAAGGSSFPVLTHSIPLTFAGKTLELRGYLRTEDVTGFAGLWMRQDGGTALAFENMQSRGLKGTTEWTEYSISIPVHAEANRLFFGVLMTGSGKTWADDLQLLVDGKPIWDAPPRPEPESALTRDSEFNNGSRISIDKLTPTQIDNLALLGKVWGFLKYHHPRIAAGEFHHDFELFRVLPALLSARNRAAAQSELSKWISRLGEIPACTKCATLDDKDLHLRPQLEWLSDIKLLGRPLSETLRSIHRNRPADSKQFYVALAPGVGNPIFNHEPAYAQLAESDAGYRLLSLFRFWNIVEYWFPYRDIIGENWDKVLNEFIPKIALARTSTAYQLELMALIARIHDTHANLWSSINVRPPVGECQVAAQLRFIGKQLVVNRSEASPLQPGDVIETVGGAPVPKLIAEWSPYYAASNEPTRLRDIARFITRGACHEAAALKLRRGVETLDVKVPRVPPKDIRIARWHDQPGETFRKLNDDVAYLKLSSVNAADIAKYIDGAAGTKGLIIDIRNYPSQFVVFTLGSRLVDAPTPFARFTQGDLTNPGAFRFTPSLTIHPAEPRYTGKVVILVDEESLSQAEYTTMAFRASPRAQVVGSTTAGADGNVSAIPLPGGLRSMISGIGVFYPDKRPTQRIGIIPDVRVEPTIEGIRAGRDEVLEHAIRLITAPRPAVQKP